MIVGYVSDLHLDTGGYCPTPARCNLLIIAGDTAPIAKLMYASHNDEWLVEAVAVHDYLKRACAVADQVVIIMGNHEHDHGIFQYTAAMMRRALAKYPNIIVLDNEILEIGDYVIYAGTGWTDFKAHDIAAMQLAQFYMPDYKSIHYMGDTDPRPLTPEDTYQAHMQWYAGLQLAVDHAAASGKQLIVVTHHLPSVKSCNIAKYGRGLENYGFYSDLEHEFGPHISLWIHGHTHDSYDYTSIYTRVVCNPRGCGFTKHTLNPKFDPTKVIELP